MRNVTEDVKKIVRFVQENCEKVGTRYGRTPQQNRLTLNMLVDIFIGKIALEFFNFETCISVKKSVFFYSIRVKICQGADRNVWDGWGLLQA